MTWAPTLAARDREPFRTPGGLLAWADCAAHGPVRPLTYRRREREARYGGHTDDGMSAARVVLMPSGEGDPDGHRRWGQCGACFAMAPVRFIKYREPEPGKGGGRCDARCLNGRRQCTCRKCMGKCHGRGTCACGDVAEEEPDGDDDMGALDALQYAESLEAEP
jgi:hypothetical protein